MISNSGHDERGKYSGGSAGDQTGTEWNIISWYNRPWNVILRHPNSAVREEIAKLGEAAAKNNLIGYDQGERYTYWQHLKASNYDPAQITIKCEADCSSGVLANVKAAGYRLNISELKDINQNGYTGNMRAILKAAGFEVLTASKYLTSDKYLLRGDILLYEGHHTATNLTNGSLSGVTNKSETGSNTKSGNGSGGYMFEVKNLAKGNSGAEVKLLQRLLIGHGYSVGNSGADGEFGSNTETAVKKFQKNKNIKVNYPGTVGAKTWSKLIGV